MASPAKKKKPELGLLIGLAPKGKGPPEEGDDMDMAPEDDGDGEAMDEAFDVAASEIFGDDAEKKDALKRAIEACMKTEY